MTPAELARILAAATCIDPRVEVADGAVAAWYALIGDLPAADVSTAVQDHYRESTDRVMPAHIRRRVTAIRQERVAKVTQAELMADVDVDTPGQEWVRIVRARTELVADGVALTEVAARVPGPKPIEATRG